MKIIKQITVIVLALYGQSMLALTARQVNLYQNRIKQLEKIKTNNPVELQNIVAELQEINAALGGASAQGKTMGAQATMPALEEKMKALQAAGVEIPESGIVSYTPQASIQKATSPTIASPYEPNELAKKPKAFAGQRPRTKKGGKTAQPAEEASLESAGASSETLSGPSKKLIKKVQFLLTESQQLKEEEKLVKKVDEALFNIPLEIAYPNVLRSLTEINIDLARNEIQERECNDAQCIKEAVTLRSQIQALKLRAVEYFDLVNKVHNPPITNLQSVKTYQKPQRGGLIGIWDQFFVPAPNSIVGKLIGKMDLAALYTRITNAIAPKDKDWAALLHKVFLKELEFRIDAEMKPFRDKENAKNSKVSWLARGTFTASKIQSINEKIAAIESKTIAETYPNQLNNLKIEREMYARKGLSGYDNNRAANQYEGNEKKKEILYNLVTKLLPYANTKFFGGYTVPNNDRNLRAPEPASYEDAIIDEHCGLTYQDLVNFYTSAMQTYEELSAAGAAAGKAALAQAVQQIEEYLKAKNIEEEALKNLKIKVYDEWYSGETPQPTTPAEEKAIKESKIKAYDEWYSTQSFPTETATPEEKQELNNLIQAITKLENNVLTIDEKIVETEIKEQKAVLEDDQAKLNADALTASIVAKNPNVLYSIVENVEKAAPTVFTPKYNTKENLERSTSMFSREKLNQDGFMKRWFGLGGAKPKVEPAAEEKAVEFSDLSAERAEQVAQELTDYDANPYNQAYEGGV